MKRTLLCLVLIFLASCKLDESALHGYVEGEYLYIAPTTAGVLKSLSVQRGDQVKQGQDLFAIDDTELRASISSAQAEIAKANANLKNLLKGKRAEEIQVILKQKEQASAKLQNARQEYERAKKLVASNALSRSEHDRRESDYKTAQANVEELAAQLKVATLGAREEEINAAQSTLDVAKQRLIQVEKQLEDSAPKAPADSYVENTFFRAGEYIPAGKAVVSLLPPENVKIRFFIPQSRLPEIAQSKAITITCDGCDKPIAAKISYISSQEEYTPPVIYSTESRQKLVFMVEAIPNAPESMFHPGLPVDITIEAP